MIACGFDYVHDLKYEDKQEWVGHLRQDDNVIVWFKVEEEGHGFNRLFRGSILRICAPNITRHEYTFRVTWEEDENQAKEL